MNTKPHDCSVVLGVLSDAISFSFSSAVVPENLKGGDELSSPVDCLAEEGRLVPGGGVDKCCCEVIDFGLGDEG